ncbi:hypothetical protein Mal15_10690 [Stieleria maiorica]|uniref:Uncharacterized protein n=1 Tax=Stieleria maiorica TaxID=2795974 RepID=A0A5B9M8T3_9BACT|nr:hypothetical protein Mal15_10690 [Stieleria maiorica]
MLPKKVFRRIGSLQNLVFAAETHHSNWQSEFFSRPNRRLARALLFHHSDASKGEIDRRIGPRSPVMNTLNFDTFSTTHPRPDERKSQRG